MSNQVNELNGVYTLIDWQKGIWLKGKLFFGEEFFGIFQKEGSAEMLAATENSLMIKKMKIGDLYEFVCVVDNDFAFGASGTYNGYYVFSPKQKITENKLGKGELRYEVGDY